MHRALFRLEVLVLVTASACLAQENAPPADVAILHPVSWSHANSTLAGAGEFEVLLRIAQLQRSSPTIGLVIIGDRHGTRAGGGEIALAQAALTGVAVVKLAPAGQVAPSPLGIFLDGGRLEAEQARRILAASLEIHGSPPRVATVERPTMRELAAIREHLALFQAALNAASAQQVAAR